MREPVKGELRSYPDLDALARAAATHFVELAVSSITLNRRFSVALSGGETPRAMYQLLATPEFSSRIDWKYVHLFWSDERCVSPEDPKSNYGMAWKALIDHIPILMDNIHRILGEEDPLVAAETYEQDLKDHFKAGLPRLDLVLLGLGEDGHTASIFPRSSATSEMRRLCVAVQHPLTNQWRVTLAYPTINAAANVTFLVAGASKSRMLQIVRSGLNDPEDFPASSVDPGDGTLLWLCDQEARGSS
jgi:6-phosphogluconolactonase